MNTPSNGLGATLGSPQGGSFGPAPFHIEKEAEPGKAAVFSVRGELDLHEAPELQERIAAAIDEGARLVVVDLTEVTFIDSMALGVLLAAVNRLRVSDGRLRLVVPNPSIRRIFEISLLDQVFTLDATRDDALAAGEGPS